MNPPRIIGAVLLVVGVILFIVGLNASHSMADRISDTFSGRFTEGTTWYIIGGMALVCTPKTDPGGMRVSVVDWGGLGEERRLSG